MATQKDTVTYILDCLDDPTVFSARPMFGEYALYTDDKVVGLICDDTLYVKILPESQALEQICEKSPAYPGSKPYYVVAEEQLTSIPELVRILHAIAAALPAKKSKHKTAWVLSY